MAAQTFTVSNPGSSNVVLDQFVFETPQGIKHVANLVNFGGSATFTDQQFVVVTPTLLPNQSKTFTVDHEYVSGPLGIRRGNIFITSASGKTFTICTNITVSTSALISQPETEPESFPTPVPTPVTIVPTYRFTSPSASASVQEGQSITFTIATTFVPDGTTLWWAATGVGGATPDDSLSPFPPQGSVVVNGNQASITINVATDENTPELGEGFAVRLYSTEADRNNYGPGLTQSAIVAIVDVPPPAPGAVNL